MKQRHVKKFENRVKELSSFVEKNHIPIKDLNLLNIALTHTSFINEHKNKKYHDNERLEFLGDAVLDLVVGEYLFKRFPQWSEGNLTRAKASVVCLQSCAECAARFEVGEHILLGRGEELSGGRTRESILGDAFEAIIGAIYLDNDYTTTVSFVLAHMKKFLDMVEQGTYDHDYKSDLQELVQQQGNINITYVVAKNEGPDHDKTIWMDVYIAGKCMGHGVGKSKKSAAQQAAKEALQCIKNNIL